MQKGRIKKLLRCITTLIAFIFIVSIAPACSKTPSETPEVEKSEGAVVDTDKVKTLVESFGNQLEKVSLQSPKDILERDMKKYYGPFLHEELITEWLEDPSKAIGRLTSSPWPDHIEIANINKINDDKYEVIGDVIEITSIEAVEGGYADKYGVSLIVERVDGEWLITEATKS